MCISNTVADRISRADFAKRYRGVKIGFDFHALRRSIGRYYAFMSNELLADNIYGLLAQVPDLDDRLMDLLPEEAFVITRELDGLTLFASYAYEQDEDSGMGNNADILVFVHTVLVANEKQRVWVKENDKLLLKVCRDGSIATDPWELRRP